MRLRFTYKENMASFKNSIDVTLSLTPILGAVDFVLTGFYI